MNPASGLLLVAVIAAMLSLSGCGTTDTLSPANLKVLVRSHKSVYSPSDTFTGSFTLTNKSLKSIRAEFGSSLQYNVVFYDSMDALRLSYPAVAYQVLTYLELAPLAARTEHLEFPLAALAIPPGPLPTGDYRVRAWVEDHEDIYSETTMEIR